MLERALESLTIGWVTGTKSTATPHAAVAGAATSQGRTTSSSERTRDCGRTGWRLGWRNPAGWAQRGRRRQGPRVYDWARRSVGAGQGVLAAGPAQPPPGELAYYVCFGPVDTTLETGAGGLELVGPSKNALTMGPEVRKWDGWYRPSPWRCWHACLAVRRQALEPGGSWGLSHMDEKLPCTAGARLGDIWTNFRAWSRWRLPPGNAAAIPSRDTTFRG